MILCDTNIISEFMNPSPNPNVVQWLNQQDPASLYIPVITLAEVCYGLSLLPIGKRRSQLEQSFQQFCEFAFPNRILLFTVEAANQYGELRAARRAIGRPMSTLDAQIAAIAVVNQCSLVTRNTADFEHCELTLINPFIK